MWTQDICKYLIVSIIIWNITSASPNRQDLKRAFAQNCEESYNLTCLKVDLISFVERFSEKKEFEIISGLSVVKNLNASEFKTSEIIADAARSFPNDADQRLNSYVLAKIGNFLESHHLKLKLLDAQTVAEARSAFTGRRGGKLAKKGGLEVLLAAGMMMKGTLMAIGLGAIALMAGKALMTGLLALTLSAIVGLKSLASGGGKSTTYEIVAKPVYSSSHSHSISHDDSHGPGYSGYGGYARSLNFELPNSIASAKV